MRRTRLRPHHRPAGFGLLEAIVALALLAGSGMALFSWIQQSLQTATRLRIAEQQAHTIVTAQALIEAVNPAETPEGMLEVAGLTIRWRAELVEPPRRNATFSWGSQGPWLVGLYRLQVTAHDALSGTEVQFFQIRTGQRRTSPVEAGS
jgi:general secretion pathway protein I